MHLSWKPATRLPKCLLVIWKLLHVYTIRLCFSLLYILWLFCLAYYNTLRNLFKTAYHKCESLCPGAKGICLKKEISYLLLELANTYQWHCCTTSGIGLCSVSNVCMQDTYYRHWNFAPGVFAALGLVFNGRLLSALYICKGTEMTVFSGFAWSNGYYQTYRSQILFLWEIERRTKALRFMATPETSA